MQPLSRPYIPGIEGVTNNVSTFHVPLGSRAIETPKSRSRYKHLYL